MKLWGGRFTKETNQLVHNFNASISFDQKFYKQDIQGSIAHVTMLAKQGILSEDDRLVIINGLNSILNDIESGKLETMPEELRTTAKLRLEHDQLSLSDLAKLTNPPVTKSGMKHRLEKILSFAEEVRGTDLQ